MNLEAQGSRTPEVILTGSLIAGAAGFADTFAVMKWGHPIGTRNLVPEPFDIPDHGMSLAMGAGLAYHNFSRFIRKDEKSEDVNVVFDQSVDASERHSAVGRLRRAVAGCAVGALAAAGLYIGVGEVGSEAFHRVYDEKAATQSAESQKGLNMLGHFDILDLTLGLGAAYAVTKTRQKRANTTLDAIQATLPASRTKKSQKNHSSNRAPSPRTSKHPKANSRYTPPKKDR